MLACVVCARVWSHLSHRGLGLTPIGRADSCGCATVSWISGAEEDYLLAMRCAIDAYRRYFPELLYVDTTSWRHVALL